MKSTFVSSSHSATILRAIGAVAGGIAEILAICVFIGALGLWAKILVTI